MLDPVQEPAQAPVVKAPSLIGQPKRTAGGLAQAVLGAAAQYDTDEGKQKLRGAYQTLGALESFGRGSTDPTSPDLGLWASTMRREIEGFVAHKEGVPDKLRARLSSIENRITNHVGTPGATPMQLDQELAGLQSERAGIESQLASMEDLQGFERKGSWNPFTMLPGGADFLSDTKVSKVTTSKPFFGSVDADSLYVPPEIARSEITTDDMAVSALRSYMAREAPIVEENGRHFIKTPVGTFDLPDFDKVYANRQGLLKSILGMDPQNPVGPAGAMSAGTISAAITRRMTDALAPEGYGKGLLYNVRTANPSMRLEWLPDLFGDKDAYKSWRFLNDPVGAATVRAVVAKAKADGELHGSWADLLANLGVFAGETLVISKGVGALGAAGSATLKASGPIAATKAMQLETWWTGMAEGAESIPGLRYGLRGATDMTAQNVARASIEGDQSFSESVLGGISNAIPFVLANQFFGRPVAKALMRVAGSVAPLFALRATAATSDDVLRWIEALPSKQIDLREGLSKVITEPALRNGISQAIDTAATMWAVGAWHAAQMDAGARWESMPMAAKALAMMRNMNSREAIAGGLFGGATSALAIGSQLRRMRGKFDDLSPEQQAHVTSMAYDAMRHFASPNDPAVFESYMRTFEGLASANKDFPFNTIEPFSPHESATSSAGIRQQTKAAEMEQRSTVESFGERLTKQFVQAITGRWKMVRVDGYDKGKVVYRDAELGESARVMMPKDADEHSLGVKAIDESQSRFAVVRPEDPSQTVGDTKIWDTPIGAMVQAEAIARDARTRAQAEAAAAEERVRPGQPIDEVPRLKKGRKPKPAKATEPEPPPEEPPLFTPETEASVGEANARAAAERARYEAGRNSNPARVAVHLSDDTNWRDTLTSMKLDPDVETAARSMLEDMETYRAKVARIRGERQAAKAPTRSERDLVDLMDGMSAEEHETRKREVTAHAFDRPAAGATPQEAVDHAGANPAPEPLPPPPAGAKPDVGTKAPATPRTPKVRTGEFGRSMERRFRQGKSFRDYVRWRGGIRLTGPEAGDLRQTFEGKEGAGRKFGLGPMLRKETSGRGGSWEHLLEAAQQDGWFPGRTMNDLTFNDLLEALDSDISHPESNDKRAAQMAVEHGQEDPRAQEAAENVKAAGVGETYRIDQQIHDVLARGRNTASSIAQAGQAAQVAASNLFRAGILQDADAGSPRAQATIYMLAHEPEGAVDSFKAAVGTTFPDEQAAMDAWAETRDAAQAYLSFVQQAMASDAMLDPELLGAVRAYFMAIEDRSAGQPLSTETKSALSRAGAVDEKGRLAPWLPNRIASWFADRLREHFEQADDAGASTFYGVDPFMALGLFGFQDHKTQGFERDYASQRFMEASSRRGSLWGLILSTNNPISLALTEWNRNVARAAKGTFLPARAAGAEWDFINRVKAPLDARVGRIAHMTAHVLELATIGGMTLPGKMRQLWVDITRSGLFDSMSGPDQLVKRFGEDARPLWPILVATTELTNEVGAELVKQGVLTQGQFEKKRSAYFMRGRMDLLEKDVVQALKEGDVWAALGLAGRDLRQGDYDRGIPIFDPYLLLSRSMRQETNAIQFFGTLHGILDQAVGLPHGDVMRASPYVRRHYVTLAINANPASLNPIVDPVSGRRVSDSQALLAAVVSKMREGMQSKEDALEGKNISAGQRPWTEGKQRIFDALLPESGGFGIAVPMHVFQDVALLTQTIFDPPDTGALSNKAYQVADSVFLSLRRSWTVHNPVHWTLTRTGDVMNNYATGKVHFSDFIQSVLTGKGAYADAHRNVAAWRDWMAAGRPANGPEGALDVEEFANLVLGGTYTASNLTADAFDLVVGAMLSPDELTSRIASDIESRGGFGMNPGDELLSTIQEYHRRHTPFQARFDEKILNGLAANRQDAQVRVHATRAMQNVYQLYELLAKYSAYIAVRQRSPGLTKEQAAIAAAEGTGDARYINPALRRFTTRLDSGSGALLSSLYRNASTSKQAKRFFLNFARTLLQSPFLGWKSVMTPTKLRSLWQHPMKATVSLGVVALLASAMHRWMSDNPDEAERIRESQTYSRYTAGMPNLSPTQAEVLLKERTNAVDWFGRWAGNPGSRERSVVWDAMVQGLKLDPLTFKAPSVGPETYVGGATEFAPPVDMALDVANMVRNTGAMNDRDWARGVLQSISGSLPTFGLSMGMMADRLANPSGGKTTKEQLVIEGADIAKNTLPFLYPGTWPISRQGQTAIEMGPLQGQRISDWVQGVLPAYQQSPDERLGRILYQALWRSSRLLPMQDLTDQRTIVENLVAETFGGVEMLPAEKDRQVDAARRVLSQWDRIVQGSYATWVKLEHEPGAQLEQMIAAQVALAGDVDLERSKPDALVLKGSDQVRTTLGRFIAGQEPEMQPEMLRFAVRFLSADGGAWAHVGQPLLWEAAAARRVDPTLFMGLYRSSMADPLGFGLAQYVGKEIDRNPRADLNQLWPYFASTKRPPASQPDQQKAWDAVESRFRFDPTRSAFIQRPAVREHPPISEIAPKGSTLIGPGGKLLTPYVGAEGAKGFLRERGGDQ